MSAITNKMSIETIFDLLFMVWLSVNEYTLFSPRRLSLFFMCLTYLTYKDLMQRWFAKIKGNDCDSCLNKCAKQCICLLFASYLQMIFAC